MKEKVFSTDKIESLMRNKKENKKTKERGINLFKTIILKHKKELNITLV